MNLPKWPMANVLLCFMVIAAGSVAQEYRVFGMNFALDANCTSLFRLVRTYPS